MSERYTVDPASELSFEWVWRQLTSFARKMLVYGNSSDVLQVGYPCYISEAAFSDPFIPDDTDTHLQTLVVTADFTLNVPDVGYVDPSIPGEVGGHVDYYVTATGTGPYTMTPGSGVTLMDTNDTIAVGSKYILNVHRYSSTIAVAQLLAIP